MAPKPVCLLAHTGWADADHWDDGIPGRFGSALGRVADSAAFPRASRTLANVFERSVSKLGV